MTEIPDCPRPPAPRTRAEWRERFREMATPPYDLRRADRRADEAAWLARCGVGG